MLTRADTSQVQSVSQSLILEGPSMTSISSTSHCCSQHTRDAAQRKWLGTKIPGNAETNLFPYTQIYTGSHNNLSFKGVQYTPLYWAPIKCWDKEQQVNLFRSVFKKPIFSKVSRMSFQLVHDWVKELKQKKLEQETSCWHWVLRGS